MCHGKRRGKSNEARLEGQPVSVEQSGPSLASRVPTSITASMLPVGGRMSPTYTMTLPAKTPGDALPEIGEHARLPAGRESAGRHAAIAAHASLATGAGGCRGQVLGLVVEHGRQGAAVKEVEARLRDERKIALKFAVQVRRDELARLVKDGAGLSIVGSRPRGRR